MINRREMTFEQKMLFVTLPCNFAAVAVYLFYSFIFSRITIYQFAEALALGTALLLFMQFIVGPLFSNRLASHTISLDIDDWQENGFNDKQRTDLLARIMKLPLVKGVEIFFIYLVAGTVFCIWFKFRIKVSNPVEFGVVVAMIFAAFVDGIIATNTVEKLCSRYGKKLVQEGVEDNVVMKNKCFGVSIRGLYICFIFVPIIFTNILTGIYIWQNIFINKGITDSSFAHFSMIAVPTFNALLTISLALFIGYRFVGYLNNMQNAVLSMDETNIINSADIPTDLSNEFSFNMYLINKTINMFKGIFAKTSDVAVHITESTESLESLSTETASTALEQSTGVKEIVSTMEDADQLFKNIEGKVGDVSLVANKTASEVQTGINSLSENMQKMEQITEANIETISGIKALSEKIGGIWEIVTLISGIADQTKIIAFNAELEAASAGEAGKNFHIVANEIRRLAAGTMEATREIKERITEIQHSSDNLIITSEGGTEKIHEGCELTEQVNQNFASIKNAAEITAESAQDIKIIVAQQTAAFEQIVVTLKQISEGAESFSASTQTIRNTVEKLQMLADSMKNLVAYNCAGHDHAHAENI
ncbi:MAG: methyl-accepting chemotaxis protein [Treponemataceae bacterium]|nr:methyl-accepting chemotaxis protein [Treponemataceae bacterium]